MAGSFKDPDNLELQHRRYATLLTRLTNPNSGQVYEIHNDFKRALETGAVIIRRP